MWPSRRYGAPSLYWSAGLETAKASPRARIEWSAHFIVGFLGVSFMDQCNGNVNECLNDLRKLLNFQDLLYQHHCFLGGQKWFRMSKFMLLFWEIFWFFSFTEWEISSNRLAGRSRGTNLESKLIAAMRSILHKSPLAGEHIEGPLLR